MENLTEIKLTNQLKNIQNKITVFLIVIASALVILGILVLIYNFFIGDYVYKITNREFGNIIRLFNLDEEGNIPTWFSSFLLLFSSILLGIISLIKKFYKDKFTYHWIGLAVIFAILSLDEIARVHEDLGNFMRKMYEFSGIFHYAWVIPAGIFLIFLAIIYLKFIIKLSPAKVRNLFLASGIIYISSALGLELISGAHLTQYGKNFIFTLLTIVEETGEILAIIIFIYTLMSYIINHLKDISIVLTPGEIKESLFLKELNSEISDTKNIVDF